MADRNGMDDRGRVRDSRVFQFNGQRRKPKSSGLGLLRTPGQFFQRAGQIEVPGARFRGRGRMRTDEQEQ